MFCVIGFFFQLTKCSNSDGEKSKTLDEEFTNSNTSQRTVVFIVVTSPSLVTDSKRLLICPGGGGETETPDRDTLWKQIPVDRDPLDRDPPLDKNPACTDI